jgi:hypothetical protein
MTEDSTKNWIRVPTPKDKKERVHQLICINNRNNGFLKNAYHLLSQLKRSGSGMRNIIENEIYGLTDDDISIIFHFVNMVYKETPFDFNDKKFNARKETIKENGKIIKEIIRFDGNATNETVFYFSGLDDSKYSERTFNVGPNFDLAMEEIHEAINMENRYLVLKNDKFLYNNLELEIEPTTLLYQILRTVYKGFNGKSGEMQYKELFNELRKIQKIKYESTDEIRRRVRQDLTSKTMGLGEKINKVEKNGKKLFKTINGKKLVFNNEKISEQQENIEI